MTIYKDKDNYRSWLVAAYILLREVGINSEGQLEEGLGHMQKEDSMYQSYIERARCIEGYVGLDMEDFPNDLADTPLFVFTEIECPRTRAQAITVGTLNTMRVHRDSKSQHAGS